MELFRIFGTLALRGREEFNNGIDESTSRASKFAGKLGKGLASAAKIGAAAIGVAATAIGALGKKSLDAYADYEQLVGGVETLFGAGGKSIEEYAESVGKTVDEVRQEYTWLQYSQEKVMDSAANAYKTAGMSANEYMETVTSFAAALVSSLEGDTNTAAELADLAITDMADNANKMGSDMASIQNAYQGFAKQNYTMLDNLKLGYGGTKEEMQRLIDDANALNAAQGNLTNYSIESYADIVSAIHDVQDEMGITGTTAKEASTTIQGSLSMMKAAWTNLLTGIGDDTQDMDKLIDNFVESTGTAAENILPRLGKILTGIGSMIERLAPVVASAIPGLVTTVLPQLIQSGISMIKAIIQGLMQMLPQIIQYGIDLVFTLIDTISSDPDSLVETAIKLIETIVSGLIDALPKLYAAAGKLVAGLVRALISNAPNVWKAGLKLVAKIAESIVKSLGEIVKAGAKVVDAIIDGIAGAWNNLKDWFKGIWNDLFGNLSVDVSANAKGGSKSVNGSHASGLNYVPFDGYIAELHKGESVLTASEAAMYRSSKSGDVVSILNAILEKLDNMGIYLYPDKLVGGLESKMDNALGKRYASGKRLSMG